MTDKGFGQPIDNAARVMPGLDLAVAVRQMHERGNHIQGIRAIRVNLPALTIGAAIEWYTALTGWATKPIANGRTTYEAPETVRGQIAAEISRRIPNMTDDALADAFIALSDAN